jgi:hypothetical protein
MCWIEVNLKSSETKIEGTLRKVTDWELNSDGHGQGHHDGRDQDHIEDSIIAVVFRPLKTIFQFQHKCHDFIAKKTYVLKANVFC